MPRAVLFDLDGTLVESLPGIATGLNHALADQGLSTHDPSTVRSFIGNGASMLCRRAAPGADDTTITALEQRFLHHYASSWQGGTHPFPGITALLAALAAKQVPLVVLSNKPHQFTVAIVADLFPQIPFVAVLGQQPGTPRKPDPRGALELAAALRLPPADILFVGDSTVDFETALNAGMPPVLVDWGYHDRPTLLATGAPVLSSPDQILPYLQAPHPGA